MFVCVAIVLCARVFFCVFDVCDQVVASNADVCSTTLCLQCLCFCVVSVFVLTFFVCVVFFVVSVCLRVFASCVVVLLVCVFVCCYIPLGAFRCASCLAVCIDGTMG